VDKAEECRQQAAACRALAKQMIPGEQRDKLLEIAATWDTLAMDYLRADTRNRERLKVKLPNR
jgi:hypothetical protein